MAQAAAPAPTNAFPLTLELDSPNEIPRWQPLVSWLLILPHVVVLYVLNIWATICTIVAFFTVLFTKRWPEACRNYQIGVFRWNVRVLTYHGLIVDPYPPFRFGN